MKLGFVTAVIGSLSFEQVIDAAAEMGFSCVEVACWPSRYPGVCHIDADRVLEDDGYARYGTYCHPWS